MFHQLKTTKNHGKHSQNISFLFFGDRRFNFFSGTLLSSWSHETALFLKWRFLQALFRYFIQSTRHFHLLLFRYHRIIGLYFEYLYNFFGKAASVAKIQFHSFWRAAAQENRYDCFHWWKISPSAYDWSDDYFPPVWKTDRPIRICAVYYFKRQFPSEWISASI